jgi:hypothetical protein
VLFKDGNIAFYLFNPFFVSGNGIGVVGIDVALQNQPFICPVAFEQFQARDTSLSTFIFSASRGLEVAIALISAAVSTVSSTSSQERDTFLLVMICVIYRSFCSCICHK